MAKDIGDCPPQDFSKWLSRPAAVTRSWDDVLGVKRPGAPVEGALQTPLDYALHWISLGIPVFPCERHLGTPIPENWYDEASTKPEHIISWWSETPDADIGAVPSKSDPPFFVLAAHKEEGGLASLVRLEIEYGGLPEYDARLSHFNRWGDRFLWIPGRAYTSHHKIGPGLHILGEGMRTFLPPSYAPHLHYEGEE